MVSVALDTMGLLGFENVTFSCVLKKILFTLSPLFGRSVYAA